MSEPEPPKPESPGPDFGWRNVANEGMQMSNNLIKLADHVDDVLNKIAKKDKGHSGFIFPKTHPKVKDNKDHYPIGNEAHGRNALAQVAKYTKVPPWYNGTLGGLQSAVSRAVHSKYPGIKSEKKAFIDSDLLPGMLPIPDFIKLASEGDELIQVGDAVVILSDEAKQHIFFTHVGPGKGSVFAKVDMEAIKESVRGLKIPGRGVVYKVDVPNIGYNLVLPMEEASNLSDAKEVQVEKQEGPNKVYVKGFTTSAPISQFETNEMCIIIVPTSKLEYIPDALKSDKTVLDAMAAGKLYSIVSAWPGVETPRASEWGDNWAVVIPDSKSEEAAPELAPENVEEQAREHEGEVAKEEALEKGAGVRAGLLPGMIAMPMYFFRTNAMDDGENEVGARDIEAEEDAMRDARELADELPYEEEPEEEFKIDVFSPKTREEQDALRLPEQHELGMSETEIERLFGGGALDLIRLKRLFGKARDDGYKGTFADFVRYLTCDI